MRVLALDYGSKRIGIALSDELGVIASPLEVVAAQPFARFIERLKFLLSEKSVGLVLVGMPRRMSGEHGEAAMRVVEFVKSLEKEITVAIKTWDERLTTVEAQRALRSGGLNR